MLDVVTVYHNEVNRAQAFDLADSVMAWEPTSKMFLVDNTVVNRGFSKGSNLGASLGSSPFIAFINPDLTMHGRILPQLLEVFENPHVLISGESFGKHPRELRAWGLKRWVCGAMLVVRREWFEANNGFDERFVMYFEETDLCRRVESQGKIVMPVSLPVKHESPKIESKKDRDYKNYHMHRSGQLYFQKWGRDRAQRTR